MALTTRRLKNTGDPLYAPDGTLLSGKSVKFTLVDAMGNPIDVWDAETGERVVGSKTVTTNVSGEFTVDLWPNSRGNIASYYRCEVVGTDCRDIIAAIDEDVSDLLWIDFMAGGEAATPAGLSALAQHLADTTAAHAASAISTTPIDGVSGSNVQAMLASIAGLSGASTDLAYVASPTGGTVTSSSGNDATLTLADGTNAGLMAPAQHTKLAAIASGATANATDAQLRDRSTHTGTQLAATISDFSTAADARVAAAVGNTVQAHSAQLSAFAALVLAADKVLYSTGAGTPALADFTAAARTFVAAATAADQRTAIGLGNVTNHAQTQAAVVPNTAPTAGQLLVGNAGGTAYAPVAVSGDATLASSGALTVANDAVTNAKLANMAASTVKARKTASTGDPEDCTPSEVLDLLGSAARGDVLYRGSASWSLLPAGTSGYYLKTNGAGADPAWAAVAATPAGSTDGTVQVKNGSAFGASALNVDLSNQSMTLTGTQKLAFYPSTWANIIGVLMNDGSFAAMSDNYGLMIAESRAISLTDSGVTATPTVGIAFASSGKARINDGVRGSSTLRDLELRNIVGQTGYTELIEMTAPGAGAANTVRIYAEDNGSGKTRLMAIFPSGAAQQIAIEP